MTLRPSFNMRLRQYTPLGGPAGIIPDMGFTIVSGPDGPTLNATFSSVIYQSLANDVEVAVEVWADATSTWTEGRDSRFVLLTQDADDRDRTGTITVTGVGLLQWLATKAALAGVTPYSDTGTVEAILTSTTISVAGTRFTWSGHTLVESDRIRITDSGKAKGLSSGSVYFVRNVSGTTFQVSHTATGAIKSFGSSHSVHAERVRTRITNLNGHQFSKNMAVSVWDANGKNLTNGSQYYVANPLSSSIQVTDKPGGVPIEFAVGDVLTVYRYLDGPRLFKNETPGQIIGDSFLEARDRGWGQDASGTDQVFHSWTNAADSNSMAWPARVDDPTISGVSVGFQPGTPLWDQIRFMVDNGWAEFASHARTLDLFAPNTGNDFGTVGWTNVKRIGEGAQSVKVAKDLTDYRTTEIVRGDGPVEQRVSKPRSPWGVLEVYTTAAGVGSAAHAKSYANTDLTKYSAPQVGYTVTEAAQEAAWLPILDYQRGDWVQVRLVNTWTKLRVTQWSFTKDTTGVITVTVLLEAKKRALVHKVARAAHRANGGRAAMTTTTTPRESDARKGAKPSTLAVTARTTTAQDKSARGTLVASWLPVTTDEDGNDLTGASYEVVVRVDGEQYGKPVAVTKNTSVDLPAHPAGTTLAVSVRAQSSTGAWGEATDELEYVVTMPEDAVPLSPSAPVVLSTLGSVTVTWDGKVVDPIDGPIAADPSVAYVAAQRSADGGTTWVTVSQTLAQAGDLTDLGLTVGTAYQYRLVATSATGYASAASTVATVTVVGVDTAQINAAFTQQVTDAANAASSAQTIATTAQALAATKAKLTYSTSPASGSGVTAGDVWYQTDGAGKVLAQWTWSGTAWQANLFAATLLAGSIAASQLAVADFTNLWENPGFEAEQPGLATNAAAYNVPIRGVGGQGDTWGIKEIASLAAGNGSARALAIRSSATGNNDVYGQTSIPVKAGDQFYLQADVRTLNTAGTGFLRIGLRTVTAAGVVQNTWLTAAQTGPNAAWQTIGGALTISADGWVIPWFSFANNGETTNSGWFDNIVIRRRANGTLIVDGTITSTQLSSTAIDAMTITGATFRTASTAKTSGGVQIDSTGLRGYNASGTATFILTTAGALTVTGASVSGAITATSGSVTGTLTVSGVLSVTSGRITTFSNTTTQYVKMAGSYIYANAGDDSWGSNLSAGGFSSASSSGQQVTVAPGQLTYTGAFTFGGASSGDLTLGPPQSILNLQGGTSATTGATPADLMLSNDGNPRVSSNAIMNRTYSQASSNGVSSSTLFAVVTSAGTIGALNGGIFLPDVYSRNRAGQRAMLIQSDGSMGTSSSARRTKNLHDQQEWDDETLDKWMGIPTWTFDYKSDDTHAEQWGVVAEEVLEAGFKPLIYFDGTLEDPESKVDGFAYERMAVFNKLALSRIYARLQEAERRLAILDGKA